MPIDIDHINRRDLLTKSLALLGATALPLSALAEVPKNVCTITCTQTIGPCYYDGTLVRRDITEGKIGLPALLAFLVVDADTCQPIANAAIDIWHTDANGVYSAPINQMCNSRDASARALKFCRGIQTTGSDGWAYFNSIFPGWYSGRTVHIHATVRLNGGEIVTTQFYFDDALTDSIYHAHPAYTPRPNRDTTNTSDNILGGSLARMSPYIFDAKLFGGTSLVAMKTIAIRTSATRCSA